MMPDAMDIIAEILCISLLSKSNSSELTLRSISYNNNYTSQNLFLFVVFEVLFVFTLTHRFRQY